MKQNLVKMQAVISLQDWNKLIEEVYGRPYNLQQQDGCVGRETRHFSVPDEAEDFENETVPEVVNGDEMGVKFSAWLARDPKVLISTRSEAYATSLWWARNFYPSFQMVANDLCEKGHLDKGSYSIDIDW